MANEKRLIDANALIASLRESLDELRRIGDGLSHHEDKQICNGQICTFLEAIMRVREQPTVDAVEVVHGHKIVRERHRGVARYIPCPCCGSAVPGNKPYTEKLEYCSVCGKRVDDTFQNYCPNCGAKMDGDGNDI